MSQKSPLHQNLQIKNLGQKKTCLEPILQTCSALKNEIFIRKTEEMLKFGVNFSIYKISFFYSGDLNMVQYSNGLNFTNGLNFSKH